MRWRPCRRPEVATTRRSIAPIVPRPTGAPMPAVEIPSLEDQVSPEEWRIRCDLAACYRLVAAYGWTDLVFTHISARLPGTDHAFLINPYGLLFEEVTASSLVAIDQHGQPLRE